MKPTLVTLAFLFLCSFKQKEPSFTLSSFHEVPVILTVGCYFSENKKELKKENYVFYGDLDSVAYISINNKLLKFVLTNVSIDNETEISKVYNFDDYKLQLRLRYKKNEAIDEEGWTGEITIENTRGTITRKNILGTCFLY